jgi:hypothetical protein
VIRPAQALSDSLISGEAFVTAAVAVGHDPRPRPLPKCDAVAIDVDEGATLLDAGDVQRNGVDLVGVGRTAGCHRHR